jgi:hypothetical protein
MRREEGMHLAHRQRDSLLGLPDTKTCEASPQTLRLRLARSPLSQPRYAGALAALILSNRLINV